VDVFVHRAALIRSGVFLHRISNEGFMILTPGSTLQHGKYLIQHMLSQTELGVAYLASHVYLQQVVRLQTLALPTTHHGDGAEHDSFLKEVRRFAGCQHPHLARVTDCFVEQDLPYVAFENPMGMTLADIVQVGHGLSQAIAIPMIRQIGAALIQLHHHQLLHRAVNPRNIIHRKGTNSMVLTGFMPAPSPSPTVPTFHPLTDIQDLAKVLYFSLTGVTVSSENSVETLKQTLRQAQPKLAQPIEQAIFQALSPDAHTTVTSVEQWLKRLPNPTHAPALSTALSSAATSQPRGSQSAPQSPAIAPSKESDSVSQMGRSPNPAKPKATVQSGSSQSGGRTWVPIGLVATAVFMGSLGAGAGLMLRVNDQAQPGGSSLFSSEQSFPPLDDWPGTSAAQEDEASSGYLFEDPGTSSYDTSPYDYGTDAAEPLPEYIPPDEETDSLNALPDESTGEAPVFLPDKSPVENFAPPNFDKPEDATTTPLPELGQPTDDSNSGIEQPIAPPPDAAPPSESSQVTAPPTSAMSSTTNASSGDLQ
jgi:serine/threonine-protein kinase